MPVKEFSIGAGTSFGKMAASVSLSGSAGNPTDVPPSNVQVAVRMSPAELQELDTIIDVEIVDDVLRGKVVNMLYYLGTVDSKGDLSLMFGFFCAYCANCADKTTLPALQEGGWKPKSTANRVRITDQNANDVLNEFSALLNEPLHQHGGEEDDHLDDHQQEPEETLADRGLAIKNFCAQHLKVSIELTDADVTELLLLGQEIDFLKSVHSATVAALGGVYSLARVKSTSNPGGFELYLKARLAALLSKGVLRTERDSNHNRVPHISTISTLQGRFRHCSSVNVSFLRSFYAESADQATKAVHNLMVSKFASMVNMSPLVLALRAISDSGDPRLVLEPFLSAELILVGRLLLRHASLQREHKDMQGLTIGGGSLLPFLGFLSSIELDTVSWQTIPYLSEIGRHVLASQSRSFAANFRRSTLENRLPDEAQQTLKRLIDQVNERIHGRAGTSSQGENNAVAEALMNYDAQAVKSVIETAKGDAN